MTKVVDDHSNEFTESTSEFKSQGNAKCSGNKVQHLT